MMDDFYPWEVRSKHTCDEIDPVNIYSNNETLFTIKIFHGGSFISAPKKQYVNGMVDFVDMVDADEFSIWCLAQMLLALGYEDEQVLEVHFKLPGKELDDGLRVLINEHDINSFCEHVEFCKVMEIYVERKMVRPDVVEVVGPSQYDTHDSEPEKQEEGCVDDQSDPDSKDDEENLTGDVEVDMAEYRVTVEDVQEDDQENDACSDEVDPEGFGSLTDDENAPLMKTLKRLKMKKRRQSENIERSDCPFYLGQTFASKDEIKNLVKSYALSTRRQLCFLRNDKIRVRVVCMGQKPEVSKPSKQKKDGGPQKVVGRNRKECNEAGSSSGKLKFSEVKCSWVLHISRKSEEHLWVVKTVNDVHECLQTKILKTYTTSCIAKEIEPILVGNPRIPLSELQDYIQQKHQVSVSKIKMFRAKVKAKKQIKR